MNFSFLFDISKIKLIRNTVSGNWDLFRRHGSDVYIASETFPMDLLPDHAHKFVASSILDKDDQQTLDELARCGK